MAARLGSSAANNPWSRTVRSGAQEDSRRPVGLRPGEQGLPVLPDARSVRRRGGEVAARRCRAAREGARAERQTAWRRTATSAARRSSAIGGLHAHGLRVEWNTAETDLGLSVPRLALQAGRRGHRRPRGIAARSRSNASACGHRRRGENHDRRPSISSTSTTRCSTTMR